MNRGIIFGRVCYGDRWTGVKADTPYKGALITLRNVRSGKNLIKIGYSSELKHIHNTRVVESDSEGEFVLPFFWEGHQVGNVMTSAVYLISAINPGNGETGVSGSATGQFKVSTDWSTVVRKMIKVAIGGVIGSAKAKMLNKAAARRFKNMAGEYSGLASVESLFQSHDAAEHNGPGQLKAVGSCKIILG